jgi:Galactose binding lectin domain
VMWVAPEANGQGVTLDCSKRPGIHVLRASYGESCLNFRPRSPYVNSFANGNATSAVGRACDGEPLCDFAVSTLVLGDPAVGCAKNFSVQYACWPGENAKTVGLEGEANGKAVALSCPVSSGDKVGSP